MFATSKFSISNGDKTKYINIVESSIQLVELQNAAKFSNLLNAVMFLNKHGLRGKGKFYLVEYHAETLEIITETAIS